MIKGRVEESIYIGTDTRYIIRLTDKTSVIVREQNLEPGRMHKYHHGEEVGLDWNPANAMVLAE
jgi:spermidine/putrescine transport system ATP-binding protein